MHFHFWDRALPVCLCANPSSHRPVNSTCTFRGLVKIRQLPLHIHFCADISRSLQFSFARSGRYEYAFLSFLKLFSEPAPKEAAVQITQLPSVPLPFAATSIPFMQISLRPLGNLLPGMSQRILYIARCHTLYSRRCKAYIVNIC